MRVALCAATYRRPRGLARLLKAMAVLELPASVPFALAVIIVDNSPEAEAREQVTKAAQDFNWPLLYVSEPRRGITFARNAALEKATALDCDFVAFIDDDEVPAPRWLMALLAAQQHSGATAVLGAVEPVFPAGTPDWLIAGRFFETHAFNDGAEIDDAHTANVLIDLRRLAALGLRFDHRYALTGGEDTMLFRDLRDAGGRIVYAADAVVFETVPETRTRLRWLLRRWYRTGNVEAALYLRGRRRGAWRRPVNLLRGLLRIAAGGLLFLANLLVLGFGRKHRIVRPLYTFCRGCGILTSTLGWNYSEYREVHGT
jgi:GT2 family glycosyltransferase